MPQHAIVAGCPECGAKNRDNALLCRQCGAALKSLVTYAQRAPRIQEKLLLRSDFVAAATANKTRTRRLLWLLTLIAAGLGYLFGWVMQLFVEGSQGKPFAGLELSAWGGAGVLLFTVASAWWSLYALRNGDRIILEMTGATEVSRDSEPQLHNVVEEMAIAAGIPKPRVLVMETHALNAYATGMEPQHTAIVVTRGLLRQLRRDELQGVVAHEMGHIVNWDMRYATVVAVSVGLIALLCDGIRRHLRHPGPSHIKDGRWKFTVPAYLLLMLFALFAPIAAKLVQMAVSRQREFLADATSVRLTRNPQGLIDALEKLKVPPVEFKGVNRATQHLFLVNPLRDFTERASALMASHPPIALRIARLRNLGAHS